MVWNLLLASFALLFLLLGVGLAFFQIHCLALRYSVMVAWFLICIGGVWYWLCSPGYGSAAFLFLCILLQVGVWYAIPATGNKQWAPDVRYATTAQVDGTLVRLSNVRNFSWSSRDQALERWESRDYDLDQLVGMDVFLSYWMGPAIAHTLVSFAFSDGRHLVWSVEVRRQKGQKFSSFAGFFKGFEMLVVAADENDAIRLRTNHRREEVYRYPIKVDQPTMQELFLSYVALANQSAKHPAFYHTVVANCTTIVYGLASRLSGVRLPLDYRLILSGYLPAYFYKLGVLEGQEYNSLQDLILQSAVSVKAQSIDDQPYSAFIRE